jgi:PKHD-type hydroxylase
MTTRFNKNNLPDKPVKKPNLFWQWSKKLPTSVCELLLSELNESNFKPGVVDQGQIIKEVRNSKIQFLEPNHWFEGVLFNHSQYANSSTGWNFSLCAVEPVQIAKYEADDHYDWHTDANFPSVPNEFTRKLSVVALLSDPDDFEGGGLFLEGVDKNLLENRGDIVVFPSYLKHKAMPVTSGSRITAVMWIKGPPFV